MTNHSERTKMVERIRKLFAVADRDTTNENEAVAAINRAHVIMAEYNISAAEIGKGNAETAVIHNNDLLTYYAGWIKPLFSMVAKFNMCHYYYESFPTSFIKKHGFDRHARKLYVGSNSRTYLRHNFTGEEGNVIVAKIMAEYLVSTMEKLVRQACKAIPAQERTAYRYSFVTICAARISHSIQERIDAAARGVAETEGGTNLPALLSLYEQASQQARNHLKAEGVNLHTRQSLTRPSNTLGMRDGYEAGGTVGLDQQIDTDKPEGYVEAAA